MNSKQLKARLEELGFGIAHVRRVPRGTQLRAYVAVRHPNHPDVDEVRYNPDYPGMVHLYQHATKPNGYTHYDRYVGNFTIE